MCVDDLISQARKHTGEWVQVPYVKEALFVNLGALMQKWTGGKYLATVSLGEDYSWLKFLTEVFPSHLLLTLVSNRVGQLGFKSSIYSDS